MVEKKEWEGFSGRLWKEEINVRQFIQDNYTPYDGDESFLAGSTPATDKLWSVLQGLQKEERKKKRRFGYGNRNCFRYYCIQSWLY